MGLIKRHNLKPNKRKKAIERANGMCEFGDCDEKVDSSNSEIHHILAIEDDGNDSLNNLALICKKCHLNISQKKQLDEVRIEQFNEMLRKNPEMPYWRKRKLEEAINVYVEDLKKQFKFKNRL